MRIASAVAWLPIALASSPAIAQDYPTRPVRLIVPYPPGGGNDTLARIFGQKLSERWGQQIVIDNRPGAGANIGADLNPAGAGIWELPSLGRSKPGIGTQYVPGLGG